jgi:hypothetical protein
VRLGDELEDLPRDHLAVTVQHDGDQPVADDHEQDGGGPQQIGDPVTVGRGPLLDLLGAGQTVEHAMNVRATAVPTLSVRRRRVVPSVRPIADRYRTLGIVWWSCGATVG